VLLIAIWGSGLMIAAPHQCDQERAGTIVNGIAAVVFVIVSQVNWPRPSRSPWDRCSAPSWWQGGPQAAPTVYRVIIVSSVSRDR
jgi:hypothetical protein